LADARRCSYHGDESRGLRPPIHSREVLGSIPDARRDSQGRILGRDGGEHETGPVAALLPLSLSALCSLSPGGGRKLGLYKNRVVDRGRHRDAQVLYRGGAGRGHGDGPHASLSPAALVRLGATPQWLGT
jgi:hypothetical protein